MFKIEQTALLSVGLRGLNERVEPDLDSESVLDYRRKRPNLP
jgi:hypothetical protein